MKTAKIALIAGSILCFGVASAQSSETEPVAIIELGGATGWNVKGGAAAFGPDFAIEVTPIANWLELEAGTTPLFTHNSTEWDTDLLFKKPWTLSDKAEFMFGIGPEWVHTRANGTTTNAIATEAAGDFMFWPSGKHKFGWFLEPAWDYTFGPARGQSIGITAGLLIAIR